MIPSADKLEHLFNANSMKRLGIGSRRVCFEIPGTDLCVKCYRNEAEIALGKHVEKGAGPFKPHLTCRPAEWIADYWHE